MDFVNLSETISAQMGPTFARIYTTIGNWAIIIVAFIIIGHLGLHALQSIKAMYDGDKSEGSFAVVKGLAWDAASHVALGVIIFIFIANGPNLLLAFGETVGGLFEPSEASAELWGFLGPFQNLAIKLQGWLAMLIVVGGALAIIVKTILGFFELKVANSSTDTSSMALLQEAVKKSGAIAIGTVIGYVTVLHGLPIVLGIIRDVGGLVTV